VAGTFAAVLTPYSASGGVSDCQKVTALAINTSSSEIVIGPRTIFSIYASRAAGSAAASDSGTVNFRLGPAGLGAATAADPGLPLNSGPFIIDTGEEFSSIRVFNNTGVTGATIDVYIVRQARGR
jgi:hypothetical protein